MTTHVQPGLRLASYNIRAALGTDLRRRPARIVQAIADLAADIVALQEADRRLGERPAAIQADAIRTATGLAPLPLGQSSASLGWHGIALLARPDITLEHAHRFDLPGLEPRGAVIADLASPIGPLRVAALHLGLLRSSRRAQLAHVHAELTRLATRPTVIIGDFNEWRAEAGLEPLKAHYQLVTPGRTFPSRRPLAALDRIAHCHRLTIHPETPRAQSHPAPSDHLPIVAQIALSRELATPEGLEPSTC